MYFALAFAFFVLSSVLLITLGPGYFGREWVRLIIFTATSVTVWRLFFTRRRIQKRPPRTPQEIQNALEALLLSQKPLHHHPPRTVEMPIVNNDVKEERKIMNTTTLVPSKYTAAFLTIGLVVVAAVQSAIVGGITQVEAFQLAALVIGAFATYFFPLLEGAWAAGLKVAGAVAGGVLAAIVPIVDTANGGAGWTPEAVTIVVFAGLNALAAQFGVDRRVDAAKEALADPTVPNAVPSAVDPSAVHSASRV